MIFNKQNPNEIKKQEKLQVLNKTWYSDRYYSLILQRNLIFFFSIATVIAITILSIINYNIIRSRKIIPLVIEVNKKTGVPTIIDYNSISDFTSSKVTQEYFIYQFLNARESYIPDLVKYNYNQVVRVFLESGLYMSFRRQVYGINGYISKYGVLSKVEVKIKSLQYLENNLVQVRFLLQHKNKYDSISKEEHKIAILRFKFTEMELTFKERMINPFGFQVTEYNVNDEYNVDGKK